MTTMYWWMHWLEYLGVIAFAASGAFLAQKKRMDVFGVSVLGLAAATGGGVFRDLLLGITPPTMFRDPIFAFIAIGTSLVTMIPVLRKLGNAHPAQRDHIVGIMDTAGLGVFTVLGVRTAIAAFPDSNLFLLCFIGVITGCGGGILRDLLAGETPAVFCKRIYAVACLAGALICALLWKLSPFAAMIVGTLAVVSLRNISEHYHWNLPGGSQE